MKPRILSLILTFALLLFGGLFGIAGMSIAVIIAVAIK